MEQPVTGHLEALALLDNKMQNPKDSEYYSRRAEKARRLADAATDPGVRFIHLQMFGQYEKLAAGEQVKMAIAGKS